MDPTRKVTIIKDEGSSERKKKSKSDTLKNPKPGTSKSSYKSPKSPTAKKERKMKRMRLTHNIRKATPEDIEGIILQEPVDDDVLIIDMSQEEIAEILNGHNVTDEPINDHRLIKRYFKSFQPIKIDDDLYPEEGEVEIIDEEIPDILEKTPDEDPSRFDVIDLTEDDDDDLEEERENLHAQLVDKYVGLAEERLSPDFKGYKSLSPSKLSYSQENPLDCPVDLTKGNSGDNPKDNPDIEEKKE